MIRNRGTIWTPRTLQTGSFRWLLVLLLLGAGLNPKEALAQNSVYAWGDNSKGQLGDGTTISRSTPGQVNGLTGVVSIAAGIGHNLVLKSDGAVWAWGFNNDGQLGDGTTTDRHTPVQISGLTGVTALSGGVNFSLALKSDGTVWAWGNNDSGELGDGTTTNRSTPIQVSGLTNITVIAGKGQHALALRNDGTIWAWGLNNLGQLGDGTTTNRSTPVQVNGLTNVIAIAGSNNHTLALKSDGSVWACGYNGDGELGDGTTTDRHSPIQVSGLTNVIAIAVGQDNSLALKSDGTVWAWGAGPLGDGTMTSRTTPIQVSGLTNITAIAGAGSGSGSHRLALAKDGTVWAWGFNNDGQLGDGTTMNRTTPVQVSRLTHVTAIAAGIYHSVVLVQAVGEDPDINRDGSPDLLWQNSTTGDVTVWYMNEAAWSGTWDYLGRGVPTDWKVVGSHDFNGDGKTDLLWQNSQTGDVTVWYMDGTAWTGNWDYIAHSVPTDWKIAAVMDVNKDGKADLIWENSTTGDVTVWYMNGAVWTGQWDYIAHGVPTAWKIVRTH